MAFGTTDVVVAVEKVSLNSDQLSERESSPTGEPESSRSPVNSYPLFLGGGDGGDTVGWPAFCFPFSRFSFLRITEGDDMLGDGSLLKTLLL